MEIFIHIILYNSNFIYFNKNLIKNKHTLLSDSQIKSHATSMCSFGFVITDPDFPFYCKGTL